MYGQEYQKMIGKRIQGITLAQDKKSLTITLTNRDKIEGVVEADCCSNTWIEHLEIPADIEGAEIMDIDDDTPIKKINNEEECELLQIYCTKIVTTKGYIDIEYRNSSNGYYGGSLFFSYVELKGETK